MKKLALALSAVAISAVSASAADLAPRYTKAPPAPPPPVLTWNGWYVGLNLGGIWSDNNDVTHTAFAGPCNVLFPGCAAVPNFSQTLAAESTFAAGLGNHGAFTAGGQFGYNYQFSPIGVVGFEADINWTDQHDSVTFNALAHNPNFPAENEFYSATISRRLDFFGTVRGRLGFLATPAFLLYGTGGLAYGGAHSSTDEFVNNPNCLGGTVPACIGAGGGSFSETRVGWTAGAGAEWKFAPNWSAKIEGLWYDLGSVHYATALQQHCVQPTCAVPGGLYASTTGVTSLRFDGAIARVGVNYHFGGGY